MMEKQVITEEMHLEKEWFAEAGKMTIDKLPAFIDKMMNGFHHDYGTAVHAVSACALAAAWAACDIEGLTGFQAGFVMWDFIKGWTKTGNKTGLKLVDYDSMLYPQYQYKFEKLISQETWESIQKEAKRRIKEDGDHAHPLVVEHWKSIIEGVIPFGYKIGED